MVHAPTTLTGCPRSFSTKMVHSSVLGGAFGFMLGTTKGMLNEVIAASFDFISVFCVGSSLGWQAAARESVALCLFRAFCAAQ